MEVTQTQPKSSRDHKSVTFVANKPGKGATKDAMGSITQGKYLGYYCEPHCGHSRAFGDPKSFWGPTGWDKPTASTVCLICSCQSPGKEMPPPFSKALLNSQIQDLHSSISANYSDFLQIRFFFFPCK